MNNFASDQLVYSAWVLILGYMAVILFFVIRGALKVKSISDYAIGSVAFSPVAVGLSLAASMTSAATFIINPGFIALYGLSGVLSMAVVLPAAALLSLYILTKKFRSVGTVVKAHTLSQWVGARYKDRGYSLFFAFLSLLLVTFIVLICVGLTTVLSKVLNAEEVYVLAGIIVFVFGYMMFGGANSMVYTNMIQAVLMLIVAFILLGSGYEHFSSGVHGFIAKLRAVDPSLVTLTNPGSFLFRDYFEIIVCQVIVGAAIVCQPHIITKSLMLKSDKDVNAYLAVGIVVEVIFFFVVFTGLYARLAFPDMMVNGAPLKVDNVMSAYVVSEFPVYVGLLVILGLISAGLSTLEGLIQSLSIGITSDIIKPLTNNKLITSTPGQGGISEVAINKIVITVLAAASFYFSYGQLVNPTLSVGIFAQNGVYAYFSAAFFPVLIGTFMRNVPLVAPVSASVTAVLVHFAVYYGQITPYMQVPVKNPGIAAALAIVASLAVGFTCLLIFKNKPKVVMHTARAD